MWKRRGRFRKYSLHPLRKDDLRCDTGWPFFDVSVFVLVSVRVVATVRVVGSFELISFFKFFVRWPSYVHKIVNRYRLDKFKLFYLLEICN